MERHPTHGRRLVLDLGVCILLVVSGSVVMTVATFAFPSGPGLGTAVWWLGVASILVGIWRLRYLRWWLLVVAPVALVIAAVLYIGGFGAGLVSPVSRSDAPEGCEGWNRYIGEVNTYSPSLNRRIEGVMSGEPAVLTPAIRAFENDVENWRSANPPPKATALNEQLIAVIEGWIGVFEAKRDGSYHDGLLYELQAKDDELERLTREANTACAS